MSELDHLTEVPVAPAERVEAERKGNPEDQILQALSPKVLGPQIVIGGFGPFGVYELVAHAFHQSDPVALAWSALPAALLVVFEWVVKKAISAVGILVLAGIVGGLLVTWATNGNEFLFKVRQSLPGGLFGLACLLSLFFGSRPMMFHVGKLLTKTLDRSAAEEFDVLWDEPRGRRTFNVLTLVWGVGLLFETSVTVTLIVKVSTAKFLAINPLTSGVIFLGLLFWTIFYIRSSGERMDAQELAAATAKALPDVT